MNNVGTYFLNNYNDSISIDDNIIKGKKYRITILTDRLIRLEYNVKGIFEDRPTERVIFRKFPKVEFQMSETDTLLQIVTTYFTLYYDKEKSFKGGKFTPGSNLRILLNNTDRMWYYNHPEVRNFGGIGFSLDNYNGILKEEKGLYSTDGFTSLDDTDSLLLNEDGSYEKRQEKGIDIYVFMYKKDFGLCLQDYYTLTGYPMLLPRYALGTLWYKNHKYNVNSLVKLLDKFQEEKVNLSGVILGSKWCLDGDPLEFNHELLDGKSFKELGNKYNVKTGLTLNPGLKVKVGGAGFKSISGNINLDKKQFYSFLPLSNQSLNMYSIYGIRKWIDMGIDSFVIDYNNIKDKKSIALLTHNCYAIGSIFSNKRMLVFSRNHGFATHRNTVIFTGKTKVDWNTLTVLPRYNATASNNGISYIAHSIGGYYGGVENFELYIRYIQLGCFSSMLVLAHDDGFYYKREPWRWNEQQAEIIKKYLNLRNSLIPYLYSEAFIYYKYGSPIIQPLYYKYPKIYDEPNYKNQYFLGSEMLVCPITKKKNTIMNRVVQRMFIPEGVWYEFESGKKYIGNRYYMSFYKDEDYPVFCREGAIIPLSLDSGTNIPNNMEIVVMPGADGHYNLYEDDGLSMNYKNNSFAMTEINFSYQKEKYELIINHTGYTDILPPTRNYRIRFKNTKQANFINILSGLRSIPGNYYIEKNDLIIDIKDVSTSSNIKIEISDDNSIENSTIRLINEDINGIIEDLEIETYLKEKIGSVLFSNLSIKKKRIAIRKLKKYKIEEKFIKMFLNLLEYIDTV